MDITKNCHTCKHEHNSSSSDPCSTCDASYKWNLDDATYNNWEPAEEEKLCKTCGVASIEDQIMVCTHCYDHNKWRPKEEKKMNTGYTDMKNEEATRHNCEQAEPVKQSISYLGQSALSTLTEINEKLCSIERFVDYGDAGLGDWGTPGSPDNLMHNMHVINSALSDINHRLGLLQEKL